MAKKNVEGMAITAVQAETVTFEVAHIKRLRAALEFIAEGADQISEAGNSQMPGFVAYGFAEVMRWAAQELDSDRRAELHSH